MSVSFVVHHDPEGINTRDLSSAESGTVLLNWLISEYGQLGFTTPTILSVNGEEVDQKSFDEMSRILISGDVVDIYHRPQGAELVWAAVFAVISFAISADISPPPTPDNPNFPRAAESPNNKVSGQTNVARLMGRIPDIYGRMRVYPDLGSETVTEYIGHVKFVTEYLIIGRGEYQIDQLKSGETLIEGIQGTNATIYNPNDIIPELITPISSNEVNGQELKAPNQANIFDVDVSGIQFTNSGTMSTDDNDMAAFGSLTAGDEFIISGTVSNNGTFTFVKLQTQIVPPQEGVPQQTTYRLFVEEATVAEFVAGETNFADVVSPALVGAFVVPSEPQEVWIDLICQRGLTDRRNSPAVAVSASFDVTLEELDAVGNVIETFVYEFTLSDNTIDERFYTLKIEVPNVGAKYQISIERTTPTINDASYYDTFKWDKMAGVTKNTNYDQGNITSVVLQTQATEQATRSQERKFNLIATRKLRSYDTGTNSIIPTLAATSRMADAMLHHLTDPFNGNKSDSDIDLDGLYDLQEAMEGDTNYGDDLGKFCHSFSGDKVSVKDELLTIAQACRVVINKVGNRVEFTRDEVKPIRTAMFTARGKKPNSESKSFRMQKQDDQSGIELQWTHEDTGEAFTIKLPNDSVQNPKKIEAAGIRNFKQAWNRAQIEFEKQKRRRESVKFQYTKDAILLQPGDRVANADGTDVRAQSGEVRAIDGLNVETYTPIDFDGNLTAMVTLRSANGTISPEIEVTPRVDGIDGFILDSLPAFPIVVRGDNDYQVGTNYLFALTDQTKIKDYVLQKRSISGDYVTIELSNYDDAIYAADAIRPPSHETTVLPITINRVESASVVFEPMVDLSAVAAEALALTNTPNGSTFTADSAANSIVRFVIDNVGGWLINGINLISGSSGDYRAGVSGIDNTSYEIRITSIDTVGSGSITYLGGATNGNWVALTGGQGIELTSNFGAPATNAIVTVEIREILNILNIIAPFTFTLEAETDDPI